MTTNPDPMDTTECPRCWVPVRLDRVDDHIDWHLHLLATLAALPIRAAVELTDPIGLGLDKL